MLNVDASEIAEISRRASIDHLLEDIAARAPEIAYVVLEDGTNRIAYGPLAEAATAAPTPSGAAFRSVPIPRALEGLAAGEFIVGSTPVLEFTGPVDTARAGSPTLRLGLNLDGLRTAERRTLTRLTLSLAAALALGIVMIAFVVLRQQFGVLSEKHARAEEALRRRDRLAAMGELASTVAHEVRNPLNAIGMTAQRLRREFLNAGQAVSGPRRHGVEGAARRARRRDPAHRPHRPAVPRLRAAAPPLAARDQPARPARNRGRGAAREGGHPGHHHRQRCCRRRRGAVSIPISSSRPSTTCCATPSTRRPTAAAFASRRAATGRTTSSTSPTTGPGHPCRRRAEDLRPLLHRRRPTGPASASPSRTRSSRPTRAASTWNPRRARARA